MSRSRATTLAPSRAHGRHARDAAPVATPRPSPRALDLALTALVVAASIAVFHGALAYFFAQDDFTGLARARGLAPPVAFPWRWLSGQAYFTVMRGVADLTPLPYRLVTLAAHGACVALAYRLCRRFTAPGAAAIGAVFFGVHPALFTALYSVSGIGEILAAAFGLGALLLATAADARAWLALPVFAASLMSKESTLLWPLALLVPVWPRNARPRREIALALLGLATAYAIAFAARDVFGARAGVDAAAPYALGSGGTVAGNALTYLGWTVHIALPLVRSFTDAVDPGVFAAGGALAVAWLAGLAWPALRARGWLAGGVLFALALVPVLPLAHHTYHYYLYAPLASGAITVAALCDSLTRRPGARARVILLAACGLALALNGGALVHRIETYPFLDPELRADATVDRARIAANAIGDLRAASLPQGTELVFWSPASIGRERGAGADPARESYWETNVRTALSDGLAVRVCVPQVAGVRFVRAFAPAPGDRVRWAVYLPNGHVRVATQAELAAALAARGAR